MQSISSAFSDLQMIFKTCWKERSVIGSQEAIHALGKLTRSQARLFQADGRLLEVDNSTLKTGDQVEVRAGDRVPADGVVLSGQASLDTASITGESVPLEVSVGMPIYGGAINLDGLLRVIGGLARSAFCIRAMTLPSVDSSPVRVTSTRSRPSRLIAPP